VTPSSPIEHARRINRTWVVRGGLADTTARYLERLEIERPATLLVVCERAIAAARRASAEHRDPKPDFYASLFSRATPAERDEFLGNHLWTRERSVQLAQQEPTEPPS
jgi:hypothetical protein